MPTTPVNLEEVKQRYKSDNIVFTAVSENRVITREIDKSEFDAWEIFADWLINQEPEFIRLPEKEKSLSIEWHTETQIDPETGEEYTVRVLDSVEVLP